MLSEAVTFIKPKKLGGIDGFLPDCETELNGLMTYGRAAFKLDEKRMLQINRKTSHALAE